MSYNEGKRDSDIQLYVSFCVSSEWNEAGGIEDGEVVDVISFPNFALA